jgi:hypothetical protein
MYCFVVVAETSKHPAIRHCTSIHTNVEVAMYAWNVLITQPSQAASVDRTAVWWSVMGTDAGASAASPSTAAALGRRNTKETASSGKRRQERRSSTTWPPGTRRTVPLFDGARAPYRREIEDALLAACEAAAPRPESGPEYRVVTLADHNVGTSMVLGRAATAGSRGGRAAWPIVVGCGFPKTEDLGRGEKLT